MSASLPEFLSFFVGSSDASDGSRGMKIALQVTDLVLGDPVNQSPRYSQLHLTVESRALIATTCSVAMRSNRLPQPRGVRLSQLPPKRRVYQTNVVLVQKAEEQARQIEELQRRVAELTRAQQEQPDGETPPAVPTGETHELPIGTPVQETVKASPIVDIEGSSGDWKRVFKELVTYIAPTLVGFTGGWIFGYFVGHTLIFATFGACLGFACTFENGRQRLLELLQQLTNLPQQVYKMSPESKSLLLSVLQEAKCPSYLLQPLEVLLGMQKGKVFVPM